jgi:hypothetical protein
MDWVLAHKSLDDLGEDFTGLRQAIEIVLPGAAWRDDPAVAEQGQVVADRRLALAERFA